MQYATPQFIEEEAKIIAFLTFKQFFWLIGAGGACLLFFYTLPFYFFVLFSLIVGGGIVAIAFVKVNNASLLKIFMNFIGFSFGTKTYTWKRKENLNPFSAQKTPVTGIIEQAKPMPKMQQSKLQSIRIMIDTKR